MENKELKISLESYYWECGDGCCSFYQDKLSVNGEYIKNIDDSDRFELLSTVLEHLGYEVEIEWK